MDNTECQFQDRSMPADDAFLLLPTPFPKTPFGRYRLCQRFRKGVGGQRGLGQGNPSHAIDSGLFSASFFLRPLMSRRTPFSGTFFAVFLGAVDRQPHPANPFSKPLIVVTVLLFPRDCGCAHSLEARKSPLQM